jgi:hypothetical protein
MSPDPALPMHTCPEKLNAKQQGDVFFLREQGDVFFCLMPLKYTGLQGPEKRDELQPTYADSMRIGFIPFFGTSVKA